VRAVDLTLWLLAGRDGAQRALASAQEEDEPPSAPPGADRRWKRARERVRIEGNIRVEGRHPGPPPAQEGKQFDRTALDGDIKSIYAMGFFDQVNADVTPERKGVVVTFKVAERPLVRNVSVDGNEKLKEELEGALRVQPTPLDPEKARRGSGRAQALRRQGLPRCEDHLRHHARRREARSTSHTVTESAPVRVKDIEFEATTRSRAASCHGLLQTKEEWLLTPFTGAGNLNKDVLRTDVGVSPPGTTTTATSRSIDEPRSRGGEEGSRSSSSDEGDQFKIGKVEITGKELSEEQTQLASPRRNRARCSAPAPCATTCNPDEHLSEGGFAFANIDPATEVVPDDQLVNITFQVQRGSPVTVDRIRSPGTRRPRLRHPRDSAEGRSCSPPRSCARAARPCSAWASSRR
jgi:outer membrane protein insertion porin family